MGNMDVINVRSMVDGLFEVPGLVSRFLGVVKTKLASLRSISEMCLPQLFVWWLSSHICVWALKSPPIMEHSSEDSNKFVVSSLGHWLPFGQLVEIMFTFFPHSRFMTTPTASKLMVDGTSILLARIDFFIRMASPPPGPWRFRKNELDAVNLGMYFSFQFVSQMRTTSGFIVFRFALNSSSLDLYRLRAFHCRILKGLVISEDEWVCLDFYSRFCCRFRWFPVSALKWVGDWVSSEYHVFGVSTVQALVLG